MASSLPIFENPLPLVDALLMDIARRIQLPPSDYRVAVGHYEAVDKYLRRDESALAKFVARLYPQGSMAIGATIASRLRNDEFDIDVVVELDIDASNPPAHILDALFEAMNGEKGSRYYGKVERQSRCVTVAYDRMHLDLTPAILLPDKEARTSLISHAHEKEPPANHRLITANPWGFAQWFEDRTPASKMFVEAVLRKSAEPVPDHAELNDKSLPLVALQLLKRWRNKCYDSREGRCPPSIMIAYFVAAHASNHSTLFQEFKAQAKILQHVFAQAHQKSELIEVRNPACDADVFSDRWPIDLTAQNVFLADLNKLVAQLQAIEADPTVEKCAEVMNDLFGENPTKAVFEDFRKRFSQGAHSGGLHSLGGAGGIALGASSIARTASASPTYPIRRHTDFGSDG